MTRRPKLTLSSPREEAKRPASKLSAAPRLKPQSLENDRRAPGTTPSRAARSAEHAPKRAPSLPTMIKALVALAVVVGSLLLLRQRLF